MQLQIFRNIAQDIKHFVKHLYNENQDFLMLNYKLQLNKHIPKNEILSYIFV